MEPAIYINGNDLLRLKPQDAATQGIVSHLISAADRRLYACIRAFGYSSLEAAIAAFGNTITGHVDALGDFATAYETTRGYSLEYEEVCSQIGEKRLKIEWAKRCDELSVAARDAAMSLHVSLADYRPQVRAFDVQRDEAAWNALAEERAAEHREARREVVQSEPPQVESHSNQTIFGHDYEENDFWHGRRAAGQVGGPVAYDPNTQTPVFSQ
jgi:hypothetical protein